VIFNLGFALLVRSPEPQWIGVGASVGFLIAFVLLFLMVRMNRQRWLEDAAETPRVLETA
jgi:hypothetical protein